MSIIDLRQEADVSTHSRYVAGDRLCWRGRRLEVVDVVLLTPDYCQVTLRPLDRDGLPISVPASDLIDAVPA